MLPLSFWENERRELLALIAPIIERAAIEGAQRSYAKLPRMVFDNTLASTQAAAWARAHTDFLLGQLQTTTQKGTGEILAAWAERPGATVGELKAAIRTLLDVGKIRAERIAVTETTRAYANGERIAYQADGITQWTWLTNRDDIVCKICGPLNGVTKPIGEVFTMVDGMPITEPPAHVGCRCYVAPKVGDFAKENLNYNLRKYAIMRGLNPDKVLDLFWKDNDSA